MSRMVAPEVMWEVIRAGRARESLTPPSEKESGVRLMMDMSCVGRAGRRGFRGGALGESGVTVVMGRESGGRLSRCCCIVVLVTSVDMM